MRDKTFIISVFIFLVTIIAVANIASREAPVVVRTNLENLPMEIGGYAATEDVFPDAIYEELNADKHVYRHYKSLEGKQIDLYIGYYGTAKGGRTGHNPYACLPGAGWGIVESGKADLKTDSYRNGAKVNYIVACKGDAYNNSLHWYQSGGTKVLDTGIKQNIQRFLGRIFHNRNDGAFVRVSAISDWQGTEEAKLSIKAFAEKVLELLPRYWPVEN